MMPLVRLALAALVASPMAVAFPPASASPPEYQWVQVAPDAGFPPRDGAGAVVHRDSLWLLGGWNPRDARNFPRQCNNEVWRSADGRTWELVKPNTHRDADFDPTQDWEARHTAGYVAFRDRLWIIGGDPLQGHYQSDVWSSADGRAWRWENRGVPAPWGPRVLHQAVVFRDALWILGGQTLPPFAPHEEIFYRDLWRSADGVHWQQVQPREPYWSPRAMVGAVVFKERLWVIGGGLYETPSHPDRRSYHDVWSSADGVTWEQHTAAAPWSPRTYHSVAVFDHRLWVLGGFLKQGRGKRGDRNDVWYSDDGREWRELLDTPWPPRHAASVFVFDGALWVVAGHNLQADVWKLVRTRPAPPQ
ncbi:MAG: hypothetical protein JNG83_05955 [Opitutaceae bacterium]|nr:hypothetical protein [Opitutaceae bacterium]